MSPATNLPEQAQRVATQFERVRHLEYLYFRDGRHHCDHPYHSLYTGLYAQSQQQTPDPC